MSFNGNNDIKCSSIATAALSKKTEGKKKSNIFMLSAKDKQTVSELQIKKKKPNKTHTQNTVTTAGKYF